MIAGLCCCSHYSFLRAASSPDELVEQAHALGYTSLAITDECSLAGIVKAHLAARRCGLHLIVGSLFSLDDPAHPGTPVRLVLLAPNRNAYTELSTLITRGRRRSAKGEYRLGPSDLDRLIRQCLLLWLPEDDSPAMRAQGAALRAQHGDRLWLGIALRCDGDDTRRYLALHALAVALDIPMAAAHDVRMHVPQRQPLLDTLTAIRLNRPLDELGTHLPANAEAYLLPPPVIQRRYPAALLAASARIAARCTFSMNELRYEYPRELVPDGMTASAYLRALVDDGARLRWPEGTPPAVVQLLEHELALIAELKYEYYFLTVHDIVAWARAQQILCQGRGSAANSAVCFCLGITEVDPARSQLLFERFLSRERGEPPDIDVDFEHERREEVIQYIYRKYTREHAALAAALICYRRRSATRDIGKALGFGAEDIELLLKGIRPAASRRLALFDTLLPQLLGVPRHLSQHVGGFVITRAPVATLVPVENAAMPGRTIIQWDKDDLEAMGLLKIDILALGMLTAIRKTLALLDAGNRGHGPLATGAALRSEDAMRPINPVAGVARSLQASALRSEDAMRPINHDRGHGPLATGADPRSEDAMRPISSRLTMANIPPEDPATYAMLRRGDSVGVFQVESRAQMAMLPRLKPRTFYDLVVQVAIVRPGPIQGGMVHPYLRRRAGEEAVDYPSDAVKDVLERTLGVPIFQEQVIKLAMVAAGFSAGEADQLRRAMAAWKRSGELEKFREKLIDGMLARGYTPDFAERLFRQIEGFGEYGFPESHAASFALLVYVSAWLKCHHPAAFLCGLLNSLPMGFYSPSQLVQDAQRHGVTVHATDVRHSDWDCTLEPEGNAAPALRLGLRLVDGFGMAAAQRLVLARAQRPFGNLQDLKTRAALARDELDSLIAANATAGISGHRRQAHWEAGAIEGTRPLYAAQEQADPAQLADGLFLLPAGERENLLADYAATGLTLGRHPLALLRSQPPFNRCRRATELANLSSGRFVRVAGVVTNRQRPGTASGVLFVTLEDETGNLNLVVWKNVQERCRRALLDARILLVKGTVEVKDGVAHVMAGTVEDVSAALPGLAASSRDFR